MEELRKQLTVARTEIKNIRQAMTTLKRRQEKDVHELKKMLANVAVDDAGADHGRSAGKDKSESSESVPVLPPLRPLAYMDSVFRSKNGTPRQSGVCGEARGRFTLLKTVFNNPEHSLEGLEQFSHVWLLFVFHDNGPGPVHAKVRPPRLGQKTGLFSTRSPHRPNAVGLTLAKLEKVEGATVEVSGIDIIDGTPILDIKPYIPQYDQPIPASIPDYDSRPIASNTEIKDSSFVRKPDESEKLGDGFVPKSDTSVSVTKDSGELTFTKLSETNEDIAAAESLRELEADCGDHADCNITSALQIAQWINKPKLKQILFTPRALQGLDEISPDMMKFMKNSNELKKAIESILIADPRSAYRREKCGDRLYYFTVDCTHVTAWFDRDCAEVLRVRRT